MSHLPAELRNLLEKTVVEAREAAELGARAAFAALGVGDSRLPGQMKPKEKELRIRLRARARQLGDALDTKTGEQAVDRLVGEVAYEHWHRMLFARFLAESHLLVEPGSGVAVSLDEVRELARESGEDPWALAGRFAERMLPAIFRSNDPALALAMPPERLNRLDALLEALPAEVFTADDALGWVYQFWQTKRKKEVNASGRKIGAEELPAVTQLFTEPYMVQFLLHNTLGAWHAGKVLAAQPELATSATSEVEIRRACALPGYDWAYLRFVRDPAESGHWRPAAGNFPGWPGRAAEITFLDPCCGSGHFLVEALSAFLAIRQHEEGLDTRGGISAVLTDNLHGLELDPRCTQIAAFAVALAAWRKLGRADPLPPIQIACSGLAVGVPKSEWLRLAGDDPELRRGMDRLHDLFHKAPTLGSLIDPRKEVGNDLFTASLDRLEKHLSEAIGKGEILLDAAATETAVTAAGMALAVELLLDSYVLIATNVPYRTRGDHDQELVAFIDRWYRDARKDLASVFIERLKRLLRSGGSLGVVCPQNLLFLSGYKAFRETLIDQTSLNWVVRLGEHGFQSPEAAGAFTCLLGTTRRQPTEHDALFGMDAASPPSPDEKARVLRGETRPGETSFCELVVQLGLRGNPDSRITFDVRGTEPLLSLLANGVHGLGSKDSSRFFAQFWEVPARGERWEFLQTTVADVKLWGGLEQVVLWESGQGVLTERVAAVRPSLPAGWLGESRA